MINGCVVLGRLRQTGREQSDSNKVNLRPIHLPQPISPLTGRALHTLTNAILCMWAQKGVPHIAFLACKCAHNFSYSSFVNSKFHSSVAMITDLADSKIIMCIMLNKNILNVVLTSG